ncbi:NAD(P)-binding domain-containing protein [Actinomadura madurae]|uniref:NAD(P)-binding domain-containing protein n=1 Tax=Actinomadura madurae TaxID=1993 RepID=UPI00399B3BBF
MAYLADYAARLDAGIRSGQRVEKVVALAGGGQRRFEVVTAGGEVFTAPMVVAATGGFSRPYRPDLPGLQEFTGTVLHSSDYRRPGPFAGKRVVIVGAGNSAVQIAIELADHAQVTLATRHPLRFMAQKALGVDMHIWFPGRWPGRVERRHPRAHRRAAAGHRVPARSGLSGRAGRAG